MCHTATQSAESVGVRPLMDPYFPCTVPFILCRLTMLLMASLGGNSVSTLIACASPANDDLTQTLQTLSYASRAAHIVNVPMLCVDPTAAANFALRDNLSVAIAELNVRGAAAGVD